MSSLFEIPAQLAMLLSLAASTAGHDPAVATSKTLVLNTPSVRPTVVEPMEGPLRFTETGWLRALHDNPKEAERLGSGVFVTSGGRYYVPVASARRRILDARHDAEVASRVARAAADRNAARIHAVLDRRPAAADLYIAHVFGAEPTISLLKAVSAAPDAALKTSFPALSAAAPELDRGAGAPVTVAQFYRRLSASLREPPRLVAIGLRPTVVDPPGTDLIAEQLARDNVVAWQAKVDVARAQRAAQ